MKPEIKGNSNCNKNDRNALGEMIINSAKIKILSFKYLGSTINTIEEEIKERIILGNKAY
jgi:hypothetical protein